MDKWIGVVLILDKKNSIKEKETNYLGRMQTTLKHGVVLTLGGLTSQNFLNFVYQPGNCNTDKAVR